MATIIISSQDPYTQGRATNQLTSRLLASAAQLERLHAAVVTASSGYDGAPGTEFEIDPNLMSSAVQNLFGVQPSDTPGEQGAAYSYAVNRLHELWATFWADARPYVEQLDNGTV